MQEMCIWSLGGEDPLEKEMTTHSNILAWKIPGTETWQTTVPGIAKRVGQDLATTTTIITMMITYHDQLGFIPGNQDWCNILYYDQVYLVWTIILHCIVLHYNIIKHYTWTFISGNFYCIEREIQVKKSNILRCL